VERGAEINRSILKALQAIEILAQAENGCALSELAEQTGYPVSTTHRLLATLASRGYVEQDPQTRRYYLGIKILTLQAHGLRHRRLTRLAFPYLNRLKQQVNTTVNLGVRSGQDVVYLETFAPDSFLAFYSPPGTRMPLHCTAMGKVFLAFLPPEAQEDILSRLELKPLTADTITTLPALRAQLVEIARQGYAADDQEYTVGVRCLAAPVRDHSSAVVAGVSMTALADQLPRERVASTAALVVQACQEISQALGSQCNV
jgi:IclR family KDG regulon transcriptional repressor